MKVTPPPHTPQDSGFRAPSMTLVSETWKGFGGHLLWPTGASLKPSLIGYMAVERELRSSPSCLSNTFSWREHIPCGLRGRIHLPPSSSLPPSLPLECYDPQMQAFCPRHLCTLASSTGAWHKACLAFLSPLPLRERKKRVLYLQFPLYFSNHSSDTPQILSN